MVAAGTLIQGMRGTLFGMATVSETWGLAATWRVFQAFLSEVM
jgi:hypothetical protein